jgi:ferredoxin
MRVHVDFEKCRSNGLCVLAAPEVFDLDEEGFLHFETNPDASLAGAVRDAAQACPTRAIDIDEP